MGVGGRPDVCKYPPLLPDCKGENGGGISGQEILSARGANRGPRISFLGVVRLREESDEGDDFSVQGEGHTLISLKPALIKRCLTECTAWKADGNQQEGQVLVVRWALEHTRWRGIEKGQKILGWFGRRLHAAREVLPEC